MRPSTRTPARWLPRTLALLAQVAWGAVVVPRAAADVASWADWAAPGPPLPAPDSARDLALQFLEWDYLADWTAATVRGESPGELPGRWARLRELRGVAGREPSWSLERRQRGLCLYEQLELEPPALLVFCDSLKAGRYAPSSLLFAGMAEGFLLQRAGLPGCGRADDGADAIICINISSELSATMQSATSAANDLGDRLPIIVFDSTSRGAAAYRDLAKEVSGGATRRSG